MTLLAISITTVYVVNQHNLANIAPVLILDDKTSTYILVLFIDRKISDCNRFFNAFELCKLSYILMNAHVCFCNMATYTYVRI